MLELEFSCLFFQEACHFFLKTLECRILQQCFESFLDSNMKSVRLMMDLNLEFVNFLRALNVMHLLFSGANVAKNIRIVL